MGKYLLLRTGLLLPSTLLLLICTCGCASYKLGPPQDLPFRTLHVDLVKNESTAPQAEALLTRNLIEAFLRDGSLSIVEESQADATLRVTISSFGRRLAATQETDTVLGRSFGLFMESTATLTDNSNGNPYFKDRRITADEVAYADSGLNQAEFQTMPLLLRRLATRIKDSVVNTW